MIIYCVINVTDKPRLVVSYESQERAEQMFKELSEEHADEKYVFVKQFLDVQQ
jgi:hypothetical protein